MNLELNGLTALAKRCGAVDILVNNAGGIPSGHLLDIDEARWRAAWELKVFGYINLTREIYRGMCARKRGVIVNVIGVAGERLRQDYIAGGTGNAALMAFTKNLGGESVDHQVRGAASTPARSKQTACACALKNARRMNSATKTAGLNWLKTRRSGAWRSPKKSPIPCYIWPRRARLTSAAPYSR